MANLASPPENSRSNDALVLYLKTNSKYLVKVKPALVTITILIRMNELKHTSSKNAIQFKFRR